VGDEVVTNGDDNSIVTVSAIDVLFTPDQPLVSVYTLSLEANEEDCMTQQSTNEQLIIKSERSRFQEPFVNFFANGICVHNGSPFTLHVKFNDHEIALDVDTSDTILVLKEKIQHKLHIDAGLQRIMFGGRTLEDSRTLEQYNILSMCTLNLVLASGIAAGASIKQKIYEDPLPAGAWQEDNEAARVFIHLAGFEMWKSISGKLMPPTPVSARIYASHGLPWSDVWDAGVKHVAESKELAGVLSIKEFIDVSAAATTANERAQGSSTSASTSASTSTSTSQPLLVSNALAATVNDESLLIMETNVMQTHVVGTPATDGNW